MGSGRLRRRFRTWRAALDHWRELLLLRGLRPWRHSAEAGLSTLTLTLTLALALALTPTLAPTLTLTLPLTLTRWTRRLCSAL